MKQTMLFALAGLAVGCASAPGTGGMTAAADERLAEFDRTGETAACLNVAQIRQMTALDERRLLVRASGGQYYLNTTSGRCIGAARPNNRIQYALGGTTQLCRNQIITIVDNALGVVSGSCGLGAFETLERKEAEVEE
ncbi:MAG: DUF6491 family protein [Hyphococcus sp.]